MLLALRCLGCLAGGGVGWQLGVWLSVPQGSADQLLILLLTAIGAGLGVVLMPLVIPWGYVYRHYIKQRANRWS